MKTFLKLRISAFGLLTAAFAFADPVTNEIDAAKKAYESGDTAETQVALNQALALLGEMKVAEVGKALPETIGEWKGGEIDNQSAGLAILGGGGITLRRPYTSGEKSVTVDLSADSPAIGMMLGYLGNPATATAMGLKMHRMGDEKVMVNEKEGSATLIYNNRFLFQIQNSGLKPAELVGLLQGVDLKALDSVK